MWASSQNLVNDQSQVSMGKKITSVAHSMARSRFPWTWQWKQYPKENIYPESEGSFMLISGTNWREGKCHPMVYVVVYLFVFRSYLRWSVPLLIDVLCYLAVTEKNEETVMGSAENAGVHTDTRSMTSDETIPKRLRTSEGENIIEHAFLCSLCQKWVCIHEHVCVAHSVWRVYACVCTCLHISISLPLLLSESPVCCLKRHDQKLSSCVFFVWYSGLQGAWIAQ